MRTRVILLLVAAALIGFAIVARVWLASTGGYTGSPLSIPLRIASAITLGAGLLLAAGTVIWPVSRVTKPPAPPRPAGGQE